MIVFSHLHKAAGTTVVHLLRRNFGLRHLDVVPQCGYLYTEQDLKRDSSFVTKPTSIAGHGLRPHIDYGKYEDYLQWYTVIRNPIDRCISHYQHQVQKMTERKSFQDWIQNDLYRNWMVYFYGGSSSYHQAIDALERKNVRVICLSNGLQEGIKSIFPCRLGFGESKRNTSYGNQIRDEIKSNSCLMDLVLDANSEDMKLYEYMKGRSKSNSLLTLDLESMPITGKIANRIVHKIIYIPYIKLVKMQKRKD